MLAVRRVAASSVASLVRLSQAESSASARGLVTTLQALSRCCTVVPSSRPALAASCKALQRSIVTLSSAEAQGQVYTLSLCPMPIFRFTNRNGAHAQIETLNEKFVEARDEIEYAVEDAETTYFNESHKVAKDAVAEAMQLYKEVLNGLSDDDRGKLQRSMGMKMEQLKARHPLQDALFSDVHC